MTDPLVRRIERLRKRRGRHQVGAEKQAAAPAAEALEAGAVARPVGARTVNATRYRKNTSSGWLFLRGATPFLFAFGLLPVIGLGDGIFPLVTALIFSAPLWLVLTLPFFRPELRWGYSWLVGAFWAWAGFAALSTGGEGLPFLSAPDAEFFFQLVTDGEPKTSLEEIAKESEGPLAILIWSVAYQTLELLGVKKTPTIGIGVNIAFMAATGVLAMRMCNLIYGFDPQRLIRLLLGFAGCGLFILFVGVHVRDAIICLFVAALGLAWVSWLTNRSIWNLCIVGVFSVVMAPGLGFLRTEFFYVPLAMGGVATAALFLAGNSGTSRDAMLKVLGVFAAIGFVSFLAILGPALFADLEHGHTSYTEFSNASHGADSLGMSLVVNQPAAIRLFVAPPYLLLSPVPVWAGFVSGDFYHISKSLWAVYAYFLVPAFAAAFWLALTNSRLRTAPIVFLFGVFISFTIAIAMTSLESRHLGPFVPFALLACLVAMKTEQGQQGLRRVLTVCTVLGMVLVHVTWQILKMG